MKMSHLLRWVLTSALAVALLAWVLSRIDGAELRTALRVYPWWRLGASVGIGAVLMLLRSVRAQLLLPPGAPFGEVVQAVAVGFLGAVLTPMRVGMLLRPAWLARRAGIPIAVSMTAFVAERGLDIAMLLGVLGWVLVVVAPQDGLLGWVAVGLGGAWAVIMGLMVTVAMWGPDRIAGLGVTPGGWMARAVGGLAAGAHTLRGLASAPLRGVLAVLVSLLMTVLAVSVPMVVLSGVGAMPAGADTAATFWVATMTAVATVPTPGALGAYEAAGQAVLEQFGAQPTAAATGALITHAAMLAGQAVLGVLVVARTGWPRAMASTDSAH